MKTFIVTSLIVLYIFIMIVIIIWRIKTPTPQQVESNELKERDADIRRDIEREQATERDLWNKERQDISNQ